MLIPFFYLLRDNGMKPSITELLTLLEAMKKGVAGQSVDDFYYLSRACLVKDESKLDLFDRIFAAYFKGVEDSLSDLMTDVPEEWLRHQAELFLSEEERARIETMGGFEELMKALQERLDEQDERPRRWQQMDWHGGYLAALGPMVTIRKVFASGNRDHAIAVP